MRCQNVICREVSAWLKILCYNHKYKRIREASALIRRLKKINPRVLISHLIITLAYPAVRGYTAGPGGLTLFTDALTITGLVLIIGGIAYSFVLLGDFDISSFTLRRGVKRSDPEKPMDFKKFERDRREERENSFNYPLFLGIVYIIVSVILAYFVI